MAVAPDTIATIPAATRAAVEPDLIGRVMQQQLDAAGDPG
jgi:hypothetical protein